MTYNLKLKHSKLVYFLIPVEMIMNVYFITKLAINSVLNVATEFKQIISVKMQGLIFKGDSN